MFTLTDTGIILFGMEIRWYGIIIAGAILVALLLCTMREKRYGLPHETCLDAALLAVPIGIIGARAYYVLFNLEYYIKRPVEMLFIHQGGLAIYGGIIAGTLTVLLFAKFRKLKFLKLADLIAPALAMAQAMGRWGNFFNQEAYGMPITDAALQHFPIAIRLNGGSWHYATFFYESVWCALIAIYLLSREHFGKPRRDGDAFFTYIYLYALERFIVEGLRMDSLMLGPIRVSQLVSIAAVIAIDIALCARGGNKGAAVKILLMMTPIILFCAASLLPLIYAAVFALMTAGLAAIVYHIGNKGIEAAE